jgi:hypothetical protein
MLDDHVARHGWRTLHDGVYALNAAPLTRHQRWLAATLSTPETVLSHASAAACWGFRPFDGPYETVCRPGNGGRRQFGGLLVLRSRTLDGDTTERDGIPITTAPRTLIDLAPHLDARETGRALREAVRLKATTMTEVALALDRHRLRRGTTQLRELVHRYCTLPYARTRSPAEALALEILHDAGVQPPLVNTRIAGEEADLAWPSRHRILEIDGPQYHRFKDEDARKVKRWRKAGYDVRRIPSDAVFDDPGRLIALARD